MVNWGALVSHVDLGLLPSTSNRDLRERAGADPGSGHGRQNLSHCWHSIPWRLKNICNKVCMYVCGNKLERDKEGLHHFNGAPAFLGNSQSWFRSARCCVPGVFLINGSSVQIPQ